MDKKKEKYDHLTIEKKWQLYWEEKKTFQAVIDPSRPKYYVLDMFPYPSGAGLHVGHVVGYTGTDIIARYKRQKGFNVLHPMGWDSFGLQAEQYAIRTGTSPQITTEKNISTYRKQLHSLGFSYDWSREIATSHPDYYKWTQWIFTKLYEKGLAYQEKFLVNYCPELGTVLANEEVENGKSREGGYPIERRPLMQWILKITSYAERLLNDLEELDWPDHIKEIQRHWIGRSEGVQLTLFENATRQPIDLFTTRIDTLFGVTFLVLSPEHPLVDIVTSNPQKESVEAYRKEISTKTDLERTDLNENKSGVWTGAYAVHPLTEELLPIWIGDYVLMGYGTGAVMGVPGNDSRDFAFAKKYELPIIPTYDPELESKEWEIPEGFLPQDFRLEVLAGKRCWEGDGKAINGTSKKVSINGLAVRQAKSVLTSYVEEEGIGKQVVNYKLRDWLFSRQRYWGEPIPIIHFDSSQKRSLDLDELPLTLPDIDNYSPMKEGKTPLDSAKDWVNVFDEKTRQQGKRETHTMPQWAGSCWYYLRFCDPGNQTHPWSKEAEEYWMPVDLYVGGVEHAVLHLLYARFWHKVLYDIGLVSTKEPFQKLCNQGLLTATAYKKPGGGYIPEKDVEKREDKYFISGTQEEVCAQVEKMSKSKFNGVLPDDIIFHFGADTLRLYEMFMGPFYREKLWNQEAISGCRRFLDRFYSLVFSDRVFGEEVVNEKVEEGLRLSHQLVDAVEKQIEQMEFNVAIAKMMEFINRFSKLETYPREALVIATQVLYPFAPHLAEECWEHLTGNKTPLAFAPFPQANPRYLVENMGIYVIQVNGKLRSRKELPVGKTKEELIAIAKSDPKVAKYLTSEVRKVIYIPDKLLNIVVR